MHQLSPVVRAVTLVLLGTGLGACGSGGPSAAGSSSLSSPAPVTPSAASASRAAATSASAPVPASASASASVPAGADPFVRRALELLPGSDAATVRELRTMVCDELDATPTRSGAQRVVSGLVEQSGLTRPQAQEIVRLATSSGCARHSGVTR